MKFLAPNLLSPAVSTDQYCLVLKIPHQRKLLVKIYNGRAEKAFYSQITSQQVDNMLHFGDLVASGCPSVLQLSGSECVR